MQAIKETNFKFKGQTGFYRGKVRDVYYFGYEDHRLMIHSSNPAVNDLMNKKTNAAKAKVGELVYIPGSDDETLTFINRFRRDYLEIESPYDLSGESTKKEKKEKEKKEDDGF